MHKEASRVKQWASLCPSGTLPSTIDIATAVADFQMPTSITTFSLAEYDTCLLCTVVLCTGTTSPPAPSWTTSCPGPVLTESCSRMTQQPRAGIG